MMMINTASNMAVHLQYKLPYNNTCTCIKHFVLPHKQPLLPGPESIHQNVLSYNFSTAVFAGTLTLFILFKRIVNASLAKSGFTVRQWRLYGRLSY